MEEDYCDHLQRHATRLGMLLEAVAEVLDKPNPVANRMPNLGDAGNFAANFAAAGFAGIWNLVQGQVMAQTDKVNKVKGLLAIVGGIACIRTKQAAGLAVATKAAEAAAIVAGGMPQRS